MLVAVALVHTSAVAFPFNGYDAISHTLDIHCLNGQTSLSHFQTISFHHSIVWVLSLLYIMSLRYYVHIS